VTVPIALLLIAAFAAMIAGRLQLPPGRSPIPWLTLGFVAVVAIALAAQSLFPPLRVSFERNAGAIFAGEYYRLFTALWFQDGGLVGSVFNLILLFVLGPIAERVWDRRAWLLIYFGAGLTTECIVLWWHPIGAGNSIAYMGLAGSMLIASRAGVRPAPAMIFGAIGLGAGAGLALLHDIHGAALLIGAAIGLVLIRSDHGLRPRPEAAAPLA
jgi:hypothetical protein